MHKIYEADVKNCSMARDWLMRPLLRVANNRAFRRCRFLVSLFTLRRKGWTYSVDCCSSSLRDRASPETTKMQVFHRLFVQLRRVKHNAWRQINMRKIFLTYGILVFAPFGLLAQNKTNDMKPVVSNDTQLTCKLTTPELQDRKRTVLAQLKKMIEAKTELENGFKYKFKDSDEMLDLLIDFIKTERQCCDFFNFDIAINNDESIGLSITGPKGAKDFIASELEL